MSILSSPVPIRDWATTYLDWFEDHTESEFSKISYRSTIVPFIAWVEERGGIIDMHIIESFCARARPRAPRPSPNTFNRDRNVLRGMFKYLAKRRVCDPIYREEAFSVDERKVPKRVKTTAPDTAWQLLWYSELSLDERFWLGFGYYAGLRRFELANIQAGHVDLTHRELVDFPRKGGDLCTVPYGVMADIVVDGAPHLGQRVDDWFESIEKIHAGRGFDSANTLCVRADDYAGSRRTNADGWVNGDLERMLVRVGLERTAFKPHDLRRSCATNLSGLGVPPLAVAEWLNHKDLSTTQLYTTSDPTKIHASWKANRT